jgi:aminopeptidase N
VEIAAPGVVSQVEPHVWDITLDGGRDLGLSFSTEYIILTRQVRDVTVEIYALADTNVNATNRVLNDTTQALTLFEDLYGDYPWSRLAIVEGDFPDGLELSGMAFVSSDWFVGWNGEATHWLPIITVHEIAHQWFYAMVGNDQSQHPFLDEALTTYSELLYFENYHPTLTEQWWDFRIRQYDLAEGAVDSTVYDYGVWRPYINAVYFRGAQMLHAIRLALGDEIFFEWLADYVNQTRGTITTPRVFWDALPPSAYEATHHVRTRYMRNSNPLAE